MNFKRQAGNFGLAGGIAGKAMAQVGIVQHWSPSAGAGFIAGEDGLTYYAPIGHLPAGVTSLFTTQRVRFTAEGDVATIVQAL